MYVYKRIYICFGMSAAAKVLDVMPTQQDQKAHQVCVCLDMQHTSTHCNTLQHTATHCDTLQLAHQPAQQRALDPHTPHHTAAHRSTPQHTATHRSTPQHFATHCNTLPHTHLRSSACLGGSLPPSPHTLAPVLLQGQMVFNNLKNQLYIHFT